jgi:hypothetical protein
MPNYENKLLSLIMKRLECDFIWLEELEICESMAAVRVHGQLVQFCLICTRTLCVVRASLIDRVLDIWSEFEFPAFQVELPRYFCTPPIALLSTRGC